MTLKIDPCHIWNVIYNARSNRSHPPTSPNTAVATKNDHPKSDRNSLKTAETLFTLIRARQSATRMPRPLTLERHHTAPTTKSDTWISRNTVPGTESDSWTWPNHAMSFVYRKFLHLNFLRTFLLFASKLSRRVISEKNQRASYSSQFSASHPRHFPLIRPYFLGGLALGGGS